MLFSLSWPWSQAARVVAAWQSWAPHAPDALWSNLHLAAAPGGSVPTVEVGGCYLGSDGDARDLLEKLYADVGSDPSKPFLRPPPCCPRCSPRRAAPGSVTRLPPALVREAAASSPASQYAKSDYFTTPLSSSGISTLLAGIVAMQRVAGAAGGVGGIAFDALGGAVNRVEPGATAFVHRNALFRAQYTTDWTSGAGAAGSPTSTPGCASTGPRCAPTPAARRTRTTSTRT